MSRSSLQGPDHFLDILDCDMRRCGLPGNLAQLQLGLSGPPDRSVLENRLAAWSLEDPACRVVLQDGLGQTRRRMNTEGTAPALHWHHSNDAQTVLAARMHNPVTRPAAPPIVLDIIEGPSETVLGLTWDHLLMDARGGEHLLARLAGQTVEDAMVWPKSGQMPLWRRFQALRTLRPVFSRIGRGVAAPPVPGIPPRFHVHHAVANPEESRRIADRARGVHPVIGETALLLAGALRRTHSRCLEAKKQSGYLVPVAVTRRTPGSPGPILGNPISFVYILIETGQMEDSTPDMLARRIAEQFLDALKHGLIEACEKQLGLFRHIPRGAGATLMRRIMRGQMASCFFAHTGRTAFDAIQDFNFLGSAVEHVFHQPMVCHPPGLGFFACRHASRLHLAACTTWPETANPARSLFEDLLAS